MSIRSLLTRGHAAQPGNEPEETPAEVPGDRRHLLKMLGATAAGAVGASLIEGRPAAATEGDAVVAGDSNTATSETNITTTSGNGLSGFSNDTTQAGLYGVDPASSGLAFGAHPAGVIGDSNSGFGVAGVSSSSAGVFGESSTTWGVWGLTTSSTQAGVFGADDSEGGGYGVWGTSEYGTGVYGYAGVGSNGYALAGNGGLAPIYLEPAMASGPPTTGNHAPGEIYVDSNFVFYRCVGFGAPGTWVPMYSVVPLLTPVRVISTPSGADNTGGLTGPFAPNGETQTTAVLTGGSTGIPDVAVGVVGNLTLSANGGSLNGDGYLTLFAGGASNPGTSSLNSGGDAFATSNGVTIAFGTGANAGTLSFSWQGGGSPPDCQVFLDVTAYIL